MYTFKFTCSLHSSFLFKHFMHNTWPSMGGSGSCNARTTKVSEMSIFYISNMNYLTHTYLKCNTSRDHGLSGTPTFAPADASLDYRCKPNLFGTCCMYATCAYRIVRVSFRIRMFHILPSFVVAGSISWLGVLRPWCPWFTLIPFTTCSNCGIDAVNGSSKP